MSVTVCSIAPNNSDESIEVPIRYTFEEPFRSLAIGSEPNGYLIPYAPILLITKSVEVESIREAAPRIVDCLRDGSYGVDELAEVIGNSQRWMLEVVSNLENPLEWHGLSRMWWARHARGLTQSSVFDLDSRREPGGC